MNIAYALGSQGAQGQGGGQWTGLVMIVMMIAVFYFLLIRPQQRKQKQHRNFIEGLKKGDEVVTAGGLCGKISGITDNFITLEIAEKVRVKVLKSTVADIAKGE